MARSEPICQVLRTDELVCHLRCVAQHQSKKAFGGRAWARMGGNSSRLMLGQVKPGERLPLAFHQMLVRALNASAPHWSLSVMPSSICSLQIFCMRARKMIRQAWSMLYLRYDLVTGRSGITIMVKLW